jgi:hypothetical protein
MTLAMIVAAVIAVLTAVVVVLLLQRLKAREDEAQADLGWSSEFSIAKYRPMERLFLEEDYDFLAAQPGFHPKIYRKLQSERRRVFRHYLRCVQRDFDRLLTAAKTMLLAAPAVQLCHVDGSFPPAAADAGHRQRGCPPPGGRYGRHAGSAPAALPGGRGAHGLAAGVSTLTVS